MRSSTQHGDIIEVHIITTNNHHRDNKTTRVNINADKKNIHQQ